MWLDQPHKITKEVIHAVIGFCSTSEIPLLTSVPKNDVKKLTGSRWDGRAMTVDNINDLVVKFVSMVIGYRIYYSRRMNSILVATIHTAYRMGKENFDYGLAEALRSQLMENLEVVKNDKKMRFKFGQLIMGLFFYFQTFFLGIGDEQWITSTLALPQMKSNIRMLKDKFDDVSWGYFKNFKTK